MYYNPTDNNHGLAHDPFVALVVPRPIGWISTVNSAGVVNLAPYSFFNIVAHRPSFVMFASARRKDSQANAEEQGEFVASMATYDLREAVNLSSAPVAAEISEPQALGLEMTPSVAVRPPRVMRSPIALECRYHQTIGLPGYGGQPHTSSIILGEVVGIYIDDAIISNGLLDIRKIRPITRLGYLDYAVIDEVFSLPRPSAEDLHRQEALATAT
jgi:flavin reductase (DIM6/NTAB) family NADH-FMN oxidoreductase RutF